MEKGPEGLICVTLIVAVITGRAEIDCGIGDAVLVADLGPTEPRLCRFPAPAEPQTAGVLQSGIMATASPPAAGLPSAEGTLLDTTTRRLTLHPSA